MAKINNRPSKAKRLFAWFGRHKVVAVFASLFLLIGLYLVVSWAVLQIQIHVERDRFENTRHALAALAQEIPEYKTEGNGQILISNCRYTDVTIGQGTRSCSINSYTIYRSQNITTSTNLISGINKFVNARYKLSQIKSETQTGLNLATYNLYINNKLDCFIDYWYFQDSKLPFRIEGFKANIQSGLLSQISCVGGAKAEYFPLSKD